MFSSPDWRDANKANIVIFSLGFVCFFLNSSKLIQSIHYIGL